MGCVATRASPSLRHETRHTHREAVRASSFVRHAVCSSSSIMTSLRSSSPDLLFHSVNSVRRWSRVALLSLPSCSVRSARSYYATRVFTDFAWQLGNIRDVHASLRLKPGMSIHFCSESLANFASLCLVSRNCISLAVEFEWNERSAVYVCLGFRSIWNVSEGMHEDPVTWNSMSVVLGFGKCHASYIVRNEVEFIWELCQILYLKWNCRSLPLLEYVWFCFIFCMMFLKDVLWKMEGCFVF